jgi:hypothetical protein
MGGVQVLDKGDLVAGCGALTRDDRRIGKEELPDLGLLEMVCKLSHQTYFIPSFAVLSQDLVLVGEPVSVPSPQRSRVMNTDSVNRLDLESSTLNRSNIVVEWSRGISTREDIFVHEKTPDEILVLPALSQSSNLQEENSIIIHHLVTLSQEAGKMSDTNVLGHFDTGNLVVFAFRNWDITVIHAEDVALLLRDASLAKSIITPCGLVAAKSNTSSFCTIIDAGELRKGTPSAANVQHSLALLEINFFADNGKLVILELFQCLFLSGVRYNARSVDHARAEEPAVEIITAVVVVSNLLLICR